MSHDEREQKYEIWNMKYKHQRKNASFHCFFAHTLLRECMEEVVGYLYFLKAKKKSNMKYADFLFGFI